MPYFDAPATLQERPEDTLVAETVAASMNQPPSLPLISRFIDEIKYIQTATSSRLKGIQLSDQAERLHPLHEFQGAQCDMLGFARELVVKFLAAEGPKATAASFVNWLEGVVFNPTAVLSFLSGFSASDQKQLVTYLDLMNRQRYIIEPRGDGRLYCREPNKSKPNESANGSSSPFFDLEPYDTSTSKVAYQGRTQVAIWVQAPSGRFYSGTESETGKFHHSSFLAGREVKAAGDWKVIGGQLKTISALSGHYRPPLEALQGALRDLREVALLLLAGAEVEVYKRDANLKVYEKREKVLLPADQFCQLDEKSLNQYAPAD